MTGAERLALRDALLEVLRPVLTARGLTEVGDERTAAGVAAGLLAEAADALARVRLMPGLPLEGDDADVPT